MNYDKDIKRYLEEKDNIEVPENISKGIDDTLIGLKEDKKQLPYKKRINKKVIASAIIACSLIGIAVQNENVRASIEKTIHKMESFFYEDDYKSTFVDYKKVLGEIKESNGEKIKLGEFFIDGEKLYFSTKINGKEDGYYPRNIGYKFFINGEEVKSEAEGATFHYNEDGSVDILFHKYIDNIKLKETNDIKIAINKIVYINDEGGEEKENVVKGNWVFDFSFNINSVKDVVKNIEINKEISSEKFHIKLKEFKVNPFELTIRYLGNTSTDALGSPHLGILCNNRSIILPWSTVTEFEKSTAEFNINTLDMKDITVLLFDKFPGPDPSLDNAKKIKIDLSK